MKDKPFALQLGDIVTISGVHVDYDKRKPLQRFAWGTTVGSDGVSMTNLLPIPTRKIKQVKKR